MAERDFYSENSFISYPLTTASDKSFVGLNQLPVEALVDAGFMLGLDCGFVPGQHSVLLKSIVIAAGQLTLVFVCDAPGAAGFEWDFVFPFDTPFGTTAYADAHTTIGNQPAPEVGTGFVAIGDITKFTSMSVGTHLMTNPAQVEPALLQSLADSFVRSVNVANDARRCPAVCCQSSSSANSGDTAFVQASGLIGDVKFSEGFNCKIQVRETDNSVVIGALLNAGLGPTCEDVIIDENGFQRGNVCISCDGFIKTFNGVGGNDGRMNLFGQGGVTVENFPDQHKIVVTLEGDRACG